MPSINERTARVPGIGFPGFVHLAQADEIRERIVDELSRRISASGVPSPDENPDYLVIELVGFADGADNDYEMAVFSHAIDFDFERPAWCEVRGAFSRAYTIDRRQHQEPWPIIA